MSLRADVRRQRGALNLQAEPARDEGAIVLLGPNVAGTEGRAGAAAQASGV